MQDFSIWQILLAAALAGFFIFWFRPSIKANLERAKDAPKDWTGALIPIGLVALFVVLLILMVR